MKSSTQPFECLFFDLGNVLVNVHIEKLYANFANIISMPVDKIPALFEHIINEHLLFQQGKISKSYYFDIIKKLFNQPIKRDNIEKAYCEMFSLNTGVLELLNRLNGDFRLSIISNTDELHYKYIQENYKELEIFKNNTTSFEAQSLKPDSTIYKKALQINNAAPNKCLFVDDLIENVVGARKLGIESIQLVSVEQLENDLKKLAIIK
jgi:glucose-1-phosphatase